jgi:hypothetical protein
MQGQLQMIFTAAPEAWIQNSVLPTRPLSPAAHTMAVPGTTDSVWKPGPSSARQDRPPSVE